MSYGSDAVFLVRPGRVASRRQRPVAATGPSRTFADLRRSTCGFPRKNDSLNPLGQRFSL